MKKGLTVFVALIAALFAEAASNAEQTPKSLTFAAPGKGFVSLGVYAADGELIRNLLSAEPVEVGEQTVAWDGTTQLGLPALPGKYAIHGIWFPNPAAVELCDEGWFERESSLDHFRRPRWLGGVFGPPMGICANSKYLLEIFACVESVKETGIQLMDFNGNMVHRFTSFFPWDGRLACTMDEKNAYLAIWGRANEGYRLVIGKYDLDTPPRGKILCDVPVGEHVRTEDSRLKGRPTADVEGLALCGGRLYVPLKLDDKVCVIDTADGKILQTSAVPSPRGIAVKDGKIFVVSGKSVIQLDADGVVSGEPVISGLDDPAGLAFDAAGNFYIADRGSTQQSLVFSPDGKPLREIGIKGGRPRDGIYNPAGLLDPRGVCVAPDGRVWVAASAGQDFQDTTVWDQEGKMVQGFYNMRWSSGLGRLSPDRTEMLAGFPDYSDTPGLSAYKIDWEKSTWAPSWHVTITPEMTHQDDAFIGCEHGDGSTTAGYPRVPYLGVENGEVKGDNGKTYLVGGDFSIWLLDETTKHSKLASFLYTHRVHKNAAGIWEGDYDKGPDNWLTWADLNGDGKMSPDEISVAENQPLLQKVARFADGGWQLQPDLSILLLAGEGLGVPALSEAWNIYRLAPRKILPSGVPVYDWADLVKVVTLEVPDFKGGDGYKNPVRISLNRMNVQGDSVYVNADPASKTKLHLAGVDGDGWWASRNWRTTPMKFSLTTGKPAWLKLGARAPSQAKPGQMYYPGWGISGSVDGIDFVTDTLCQVWEWTDDGLFLGSVYNTDRSLFDSNSIHAELVGSFAYDIGGKTYALTGDHGVSVQRIDVPKLTPIDLGTVTLSPEMAATVKPWDPDGPPPGKKPTVIARSIFDYDFKNPHPTRTITIDGKLDPAEWAGVSTMDLLSEGKKVGTVQITFDKDNLYLAYDVDDANGLKNDGHELPFAPYVTGSYVDFILGPDWAMPNRSETKEGDVRVILARITGASPTDYQMGFWPVKQDLHRFLPKPRALNPQTIVSPAQQRHFDDISPVAGLQFAYQVSDKGYTLEVKAPFASLGINPARSPVIGFDTSVSFADPGGQVRVRAVHWAGESEATVVDRPGSIELKPVTWGTLQFDRNPLSAPEFPNASAKSNP